MGSVSDPVETDACLAPAKKRRKGATSNVISVAKRAVTRRLHKQLVLQFVMDGRDCAPRNHVVALVDTIQRTVDLDERAERALENGRQVEAIRIKQQSMHMLSELLS